MIPIKCELVAQAGKVTDLRDASVNSGRYDRSAGKVNLEFETEDGRTFGVVVDVIKWGIAR